MKQITIKLDDGAEIKAQVDESELAKLVRPERVLTGYERGANGELYYAMSINGIAEYYTSDDKSTFVRGNYVNDRQLCQDRFRARVLRDRLEQWQALNDEPVSWGDGSVKYTILYSYKYNDLDVNSWYENRYVGAVYFSTAAKAQEAIEVFRDELMWYFTEYRSRLDEQRGRDDNK